MNTIHFSGEYIIWDDADACFVKDAHCDHINNYCVCHCFPGYLLVDEKCLKSKIVLTCSIEQVLLNHLTSWIVRVFLLFVGMSIRGCGVYSFSTKTNSLKNCFLRECKLGRATYEYHEN